MANGQIDYALGTNLWQTGCISLQAIYVGLHTPLPVNWTLERKQQSEAYQLRHLLLYRIRNRHQTAVNFGNDVAHLIVYMYRDTHFRFRPSMRRCSWATTIRSTARRTCVVNLWRGHTAPSVIEHLQLLDPNYGTVFHRTWKRRTYRTIDFGCRYGYFCLDSGATAYVNYFNCAV